MSGTDYFFARGLYAPKALSPVGLDVTKIDLNTDPMELAKRIHDPLDRLIKWQGVAKEEREAPQIRAAEVGPLGGDECWTIII